MSKIKEIQELCDKHKLSITELFREANIPHATIANWQKKEPDAFFKLEKLHATLDRLIEEKNQGNRDFRKLRYKRNA